VVVVPLRVNVNLKAATVEDLVQRRKVAAYYAILRLCFSVAASLCTLTHAPWPAVADILGLLQRLHTAMVKNLR
jgi:hypothetical protein